jgi:hypothetical protein
MADETTETTPAIVGPLSEEQILELIAAGTITWSEPAIYTSELSREFIVAHKDELVFAPMGLPIDLLVDFKSKIRWEGILSSALYVDSVPMAVFEACLPEILAANAGGSLSFHQKLTEEFIEANLEHLDMVGLCYHQDLSVAFLERHVGDLVWCYVCHAQKLTAEFVAAHQDKVDWVCLSRSPVNGHLSPNS